ncbi:uncharacterized protein C2orf92 homolog [Arvicola amphibius]|uniref:uncharacterized protein C2orf92 homolog n=1 Tax=Arvicola amphibius TaxID=1047088 RepID=UPI001C07F02C|nr:uncharacterized protein C2orf92 homolog [Arvicola amphibius]
MSDTVFFSFVLFLGSQWGAEPHSIPVTEGVENSFSSSSRHLEEDLAKLFDEILLQVFPSNLDDMSNDARTAGRLITWREANETHVLPNSFNNSEFASSSHLAKLFDEILLQVFSNDPKYLSKEDTRAADELVTWRDTSESQGVGMGTVVPIPNSVSAMGNRLEGGRPLLKALILTIHQEPLKVEPRILHVSMHLQSVTARDHFLAIRTLELDALGMLTLILVSSRLDVYTERLPCRELLSFLQKNIITAAVAVAAILLVTTLVVLALVTYIRRKKARYPPANMTYNIFIMNGKTWWQKPEERYIRKFTGKQKHLKCNSSV